MKVIRVGSNAQSRIAQACDRCRSKKIRCESTMLSTAPVWTSSPLVYRVTNSNKDAMAFDPAVRSVRTLASNVEQVIS